MKEKPTRLFVYGTLMPGNALFPRIEEHVRRCRPATIRGLLVNLGSFPGLLPGDGIVRGVLLDIETEGLLITDRIEGARPNEQPCFYRRQATNIHLADGGSVRGWVYVFARPESLVDRPRLVIGERDGVPVFAWSPSSARAHGSRRSR